MLYNYITMHSAKKHKIRCCPSDKANKPIWEYKREVVQS